MRRPVKPFVTEYRGGSRRQPGSPGQGPSTEFEPPARPTEPRPAGTSRFVPASQEDGYEAALRAADALFSGSRSFDQPKSFQEQSPTAPSADISQPFAEDPAVTESKPGGRVLRVIDEPPLPELAKLEAERAPKRRGRKPGSKNKPKAAILTSTPAPSEPPAPVTRRLRAGTRDAAPVQVAAIATTPVSSVSAAVRKATPVLATPSSVPPVSSRGDKYAWVRTKLKPGERWKRRLPKIAW